MVTTHLQKQKWRLRLTAQTHNEEGSEVRFEPLAHRPHLLSFASLSGYIRLLQHKGRRGARWKKPSILRFL